MSSKCIIGLDHIENFRKILVVDANKIHEFINMLNTSDLLIVVPQTFCFDYSIALLNRAMSKLADNIKKYILSKLNIRSVSRNQLESLIKATITRKYINESRKLRKFSAENLILILNLSNECCNRHSEELYKLGIPHEQINKLIDNYDHYYSELYIILKEYVKHVKLETSDKILHRVIEQLDTRSITKNNTSSLQG